MERPMTEGQLERALAGTEGICVLVAGRENVDASVPASAAKALPMPLTNRASWARPGDCRSP